MEETKIDITPQVRSLVYQNEDSSWAWGIVTTFGQMEMNDPGAWIFESGNKYFLRREDAKADLIEEMHSLGNKIDEYVKHRLELGGYYVRSKDESDNTDSASEDDSRENGTSIQVDTTEPCNT